MTVYLVVKFVHVLVAILAIGNSAGSSLWLRLAMRDTDHFVFALRTTKVLDEYVTRPGLFLLLLTGLWMAATRWSLGLFWVRGALIIVLVVIALLYAVVGPTIGRFLRAVQAEGLFSPNSRRLGRTFELVGGGAGLLVIVVVWLMVMKPS